MRNRTLLWFLGLVVALLAALGLVVLASAGEANGIRLHSDPGYFFKRQCIYVAVGVVVAAVAAKFDYRLWRDHHWLSWLFFAAIMVLLLSVFAFRPINGSHRWLIAGPVRLQPSEFAKLMTVIHLSVLLDKCGWRVELFKQGALYPTLVLGAIALPVLFEPDFGSVMVIGLAGMLTMFAYGTRILHLLGLGALGLGLVLYKLFTNANRVARLFDESKQYQVNMALAAIGNSEIWGVGIGESMQKHLYLPEAHTDFVFAVGAEELGIVFSVGVVVLFLAFFVLSVWIAYNAADRFGRTLATGMAFIIFFQAMFNLGVVCKALPTKGMALPFFSYGGTNMLSAFFAVGTIFSVALHSSREKRHAVMRKVFIGR